MIGFREKLPFCLALSIVTIFAAMAWPAAVCAADLDRIRLNPNKTQLVYSSTGGPFVPWGFNYDRDYKMRLIEDCWIEEWKTVESDFREMKALGANIVRIHLSVAPFLESPEKPNTANVAQLKQLVGLCEAIDMRLDITGLGSYRKEAAPKWYVQTTEAQRWAIQEKFWDVVSEACNNSPAVAWYDLANEVVVPGEKQKPFEWMAGHLETFWYCQFITLDPAGRDRGEIARAWVRQMSRAIRKYSPEALITVGMLPFTSVEGQPSMGIDVPGLKNDLDLICVHVYPKAPPFKEALSLLEKFDCGKPLVIEETFPLECRPEDMPAFIDVTKTYADGWLGFYWGESIDELAPSTRPADAITRGWLEAFKGYHP